MAYSIPFIQYTTDVFGSTAGRTSPHRGHDVAPGGNMFPSWVNGVVVTAGYNPCLGYRVVVKNDDDGYFVGVSHLVGAAVKVGERVSIGKGLGYIGNTGTCTKGRHAHITVSPSSALPESGTVIDPVAYARNGGGSSVIGYGFGLSTAAQLSSQKALQKLGLYPGKLDGVFGPASVTGMQVYLRNNGFLPADYKADGEPGPIYGIGLQKLAAKHGYTGPLDGKPGTATSEAIIRWADKLLAPAPTPTVDWKAWQTLLQGYGYTGAIDGVPGVQTYTALQKFLAEKFGYAGTIDGKPGELTWAAFNKAVQAGYPKAGLPTAPPITVDWKAWQTFLRAWGYEGAIDGVPGTNTYIALQKFLAKHFGYTGPQDGAPGDFTWTAFEKAVAAGYPKSGGTTTPPPPPPDPEAAEPLPGSFFTDLAKYQVGISYAKLKEKGVQAVIVKASGFNIAPLYVADGYKTHVDGSRHAGLFVGHYFVPGKTSAKTPEEQAQFMIDSLYDFRVEEDVLMFDNEVLDANGYLFTPDEVRRFVDYLHEETGIPYRRIFVYAGAKDWRGEHSPWAKVLELPVRIVWAAYGDFPEGRRPDHEPLLMDKISRWDVHQFTSTGLKSVWPAGIDLNHSPIPIEELWKPGDVNEEEEEPPPPPADRLPEFLNLLREIMPVLVSTHNAEGDRLSDVNDLISRFS